MATIAVNPSIQSCKDLQLIFKLCYIWASKVDINEV